MSRKLTKDQEISLEVPFMLDSPGVLLQLKDDSNSLQDTEAGGVAMSAKKRRRRNFSPEEKAAILRRHLAAKVSVGKALVQQMRAGPRPEPDSGNPTVRDRREALENVTMGAGLRPSAKALDPPPDPNVRAHSFYPDNSHVRF
jgi:hypothetical protein